MDSIDKQKSDAKNTRTVVTYLALWGLGALGLALIPDRSVVAEALLTVTLVLLPFLVLEPLIVLVHELGHALAVLAVTPYDTVVQIGLWNPWISLRLGRLDIRWSAWGPLARCTYPAEIAPRQEAMVAMAGPIASLLLVAPFALVAVLLWGSADKLAVTMSLAALSSLLVAISNAIPVKEAPDWVPNALVGEPGQASDGYTVRAALREASAAR